LVNVFFIYNLLFFKFLKNRSRDEVYKACGAKRIGWDSEEESADEEPEFGSSSINPEEEYRLLRLAADYLLRQNRLVELERLCFTALTSPLFRKKPDIHRECRFLTLQVCMAKGDSYYAYNLARSLLLSHLNNSRVWNLFIQVIMRGDDIRHNRFLMRLMMKHPGMKQ
jgi:general transcription factor 3C polypeptide 3 (transcription factor C subunit 4)